MSFETRYVSLCIAALIAVTALFVGGQSFFAAASHDPAAETVQSTALELSSLQNTAAEMRPDLITAFMTDFTGGTVPLEEATGELREFTLEVTQIMSEIAPGVEVEQWAFHFPGEEPSVPGPEIRVKQGDLVRITLKNTHNQPHSIHPHGITSLAMQMDGVEATSFHVLPGQEFTYEFVAATAGTHAYHCHVQTNVHLDMGMYGPIIVEPAESDFNADREYSMTIDEWDADQNPLAAVHESDPDYFLINGKAFPLTEPMEILDGETGLIRITNVGYQTHALHLHGMAFLVVAKDGYDLEVPFQGDTLAISPGERYDILINGRDGIFPFHDHVVSSVTNAGVYPGGMLTLIAGSDPKIVTDSEKSIYFGKEAVPTPIAEADHDHSDATQHTAETQHDSVAESATPLSAEALPLLEGNVNINIEAFEFDQQVIKIKAGTTVTWTNNDEAPHTVTSGLVGEPAKARAFDSTGQKDGNMDMLMQGDSWSYTFTEEGEFDYYCLPHPFMTAKIVVEN